MLKGEEFQILGASIRNAREPNKRFCRGSESDWRMNVWTWRACDTVVGRRGVADECVDLAGL